MGLDPDRVNALNDLAALRIDDLLDRLGVRYGRCGNHYAGACPVHGGRRPDAWNVYPDGHTCRGNWVCRSRGCHAHFRNTVVGLTWGVLSHERLSWSAPEDHKVPFWAAVDYLCDFVGSRLEDVVVDHALAEKQRFAALQEVLFVGAGAGPGPGKGWPREKVRARMEVPAPYYLARGYSAAVLDRYDVGLWLGGQARSAMYGRVAVPVYDESRRLVIGVAGRSVHERCPSCRQYHGPAAGGGPTCPAPSAEHAKWYERGFRGFPKERALYNWWFARESVRATGVVVLVEGPGDVWRLEEGGVRNSLALFGSQLHDPQQVLLERSGARHVVLLPHADEAGARSRAQVERALGRSFNVHALPLRAGRKDVGEYGPQEVRADILPALRKLEGE